MNNLSSQHIFSLYRTYLRQVGVLPHAYLRIKGADDFRSVLKTKSTELRREKLKRVSRDLKRLRAANGGEPIAFDRMLDVAYGRVGKLRWELMEPLLSGPNAELTSQTNPRKERTRLPVYSPELAALLTSNISRTTRALQAHHLGSPPGLSGHARSNPEDMALLGPLSNRRRHNIRWDFFRSEWKKVYPPLQISLQHPANHTKPHISSNPQPDHGFRTALFQELLALAGSPSRSPDPTNNQKGVQQIQNTSDTKPFDGSLPLRWLRRRYQALLGRVPFLISQSSSPGSSKPIYVIELADSAMTTSRPQASRLRVVDTEDIPWISDVYLTAQSGKRRR